MRKQAAQRSGCLRSGWPNLELPSDRISDSSGFSTGHTIITSTHKECIDASRIYGSNPNDAWQFFLRRLKYSEVNTCNCYFNNCSNYFLTQQYQAASRWETKVANGDYVTVHHQKNLNYNKNKKVQVSEYPCVSKLNLLQQKSGQKRHLFPQTLMCTRVHNINI